VKAWHDFVPNADMEAMMQPTAVHIFDKITGVDVEKGNAALSLRECKLRPEHVTTNGHVCGQITDGR